MGVISAATLKTILEASCVATACAKGKTGGSYGYGIGSTGGAFGVVSRLAAIQAAAVASADLQVAGDLSRSILDAVAIADGTKYVGGLLSPMFSALQGHASRAGVANVRTLDDLMVYYNVTTATKWQVLADPIWASVYGQWLGSLVPSPMAIGWYSDNLGSKSYGGAFVAGETINSSLYAGGLPRLNITSLTGSGTVTVTGSSRDPATQAVTAGLTWTAAVTTNGTVTLVPGTAPTDALILAVSAITIGAGISAGAFVVQCETAFSRAVV